MEFWKKNNLGFFFEKPLKSCWSKESIFGERFVYDLNNTMSYITMSYSQTPFPYMWIFWWHNRFEIQKLVIIIGLIIYLNPHIGILIRCEPEMKKNKIYFVCCFWILLHTLNYSIKKKNSKYFLFLLLYIQHQPILTCMYYMFVYLTFSYFF
jgi:hypothetical protein